MRKRKRRASVSGEVAEALGDSWAWMMGKRLQMTMAWEGLMQGTEPPGKKKGHRGTADQGKTGKEVGDGIGIGIGIGMDIGGDTGAGREAQVARKKGRDISTDEIAMRANGGGIARAALRVPDGIVTDEIMTTTAGGKCGVTDTGGSIESAIGPESTMTKRDGGEGGARALVGREVLDPWTLGNSVHFWLVDCFSVFCFLF